VIRDLVLKNRSYRRFKENERIDICALRELVDLARLSASAANRQPLKYVLSTDPQTNAKIFETLAWAGYLKDWEGPAAGQRPSAYVVVLQDTEISKDLDCDHGIAAQTILLGACERGLGGCMIASVKRDKLSEVLGLPGRFKIRLVIALGVPDEEVVLEPLRPGGGIEYWRDEKGVHHVPKRPLEEIILKQY